MSGQTDPRTPMGPADRAPFGSAGGRRSHEEQIEARHMSSLPSFGALRRDNTPTAACLIILCSCSREVSVFWLTNESNRTPSTLRMGLLLYAKGVTNRWQRREGYKCKKRGGWYSYLYSAPYLTLMAGDKGIKCPSGSPK